MDYFLVSGIVHELHVTKGYEDVAFTDRSKNLIGAASIAAAAIGSSTSSTILASSSNGAEVQMEFFTCRVNDALLSGRFYKVDFREGENIDFVVTSGYRFSEVHGARNPEQCLIWSIPYRTRGNIAQKKHDIFSSLTVSAVASILFAIFSYYLESLPLAECWKNIARFSALSFSIVLIVNFLSRWPFYKFSYEATKIFEAFGFEDPSMVDLPKNHDRADKKYYKRTGEPRPWLVVPLRYRYEASACKLPSSETVENLTI